MSASAKSLAVRATALRLYEITSDYSTKCSRHLSSDAKWLFVVLRYHTNGKTGIAFPTYDTLQLETGLPRRKIAKGLRDLVDAGWALKKRRRNAATHYTLQIPTIPYSSNGGTFQNTATNITVSDSSTVETANSSDIGTLGSSSGCATNQIDLNQTERTRLNISANAPEQSNWENDPELERFKRELRLNHVDDLDPKLGTF